MLCFTRSYIFTMPAPRTVSLRVGITAQLLRTMTSFFLPLREEPASSGGPVGNCTEEPECREVVWRGDVKLHTFIRDISDWRYRVRS